jgi:hypothetical protein
MEQGAESSNASEELMRRGFYGFTLAALLFALCFYVHAQQGKKSLR